MDNAKNEETKKELKMKISMYKERIQSFRLSRVFDDVISGLLALKPNVKSSDRDLVDFDNIIVNESFVQTDDSIHVEVIRKENSENVCSQNMDAKGLSSGPLKTNDSVPTMKKFGWNNAKGVEENKIVEDTMNFDDVKFGHDVNSNVVSSKFSNIDMVEKIKKIAYNLKRTWRKVDVGEMSLDGETGIWLLKLKGEVEMKKLLENGTWLYELSHVPIGCDKETREDKKKTIDIWLELKSEPPDHIKFQWSNNMLYYFYGHYEFKSNDGVDVLSDSVGAPDFMKADDSLIENFHGRSDPVTNKVPLLCGRLSWGGLALNMGALGF
ncbi:hypothetical protein L6452_02547 [Arctium lappa]|uniref:Uncharacterized protein n=1 Tax=Arctium lappa TaxID=4217 RepID=A0ACB9FJ79_ARCLA|nr:hypothetical protein L6452_02547 [Arctium lappa]